MRPSTRTSDRERLGRRARLAVAALCGALLSLAVALPGRAVVAESWASSAQGGRKAALEGAVAEAVRVVASRHAAPEERASLAAQWKALLSAPGQYVRRYAVQSETAEGEGFRVRVAADVDRDRLLADLEKAGFSPRRPVVFPRILVAPTPEAPRLAEIVLLRLKEEGIDARMPPAAPDDAPPSPESMRATAAAQGFHLTALLAVSVSTLPALIAPGAGTLFALSETDVEVAAAGGLADSRTGAWLSRAEHKDFLRGADVEATALLGVERAAEALALRLLEDLYLSNWTPGTETVEMELTVAGLESPGLVPRLQSALAGVAELTDLRLDRLEARAAVWRARALRSGLAWDAVLGALAVSGGQVAWDPAPAGAPAGEPMRMRGRWTAR